MAWMKRIAVAAYMVFLLSATVSVAVIVEYGASILFTLGLAAIAIGFAMVDVSLAFIVPGCIVCTLTALPPLITFLRGGG